MGLSMIFLLPVFYVLYLLDKRDTRMKEKLIRQTEQELLTDPFEEWYRGSN